MDADFKKRLAVVKREASRAVKFHGDFISALSKKALDKVKNQSELDLWYEYKSSISTFSYKGDILSRRGAIEAFQIQFDI